MDKRRIGAPLAGGLLLATITAAAAQEAPPPSPAGAAECSFLGCLLHSRGEAPQPAPPEAPVAASAGGAGDAAVPAAAVPVAAVPAAAAMPGRAAAKPAAAALPAVTVAADPADKPRLKALAAAQPRHRLHLVVARAEAADLKLAPTLEAASGAGSLHLYSEVLHVVAGSAIGSLADLRGKQVSFGPADAPATAIARRLFAAAGIAVTEVPLDEGNALDGVATGDIDAVVVLAPQPAPALAALRGTALHLVSWPDGMGAPAGARPFRLAASSYPRLQKTDSSVLAVDAVLTLTPRGERSAAARDLFAALKQRAGALARHGFDRLGADLDARKSRRVASEESR